MKPVMCMAAPNGARRDKSDHPQLPLSADEIAHTAQAVADAGATALHLHVRDQDGQHSLSVDLYRQAMAAVSNACGADLLIQVTTEAAGVFAVEEQMELVYALEPAAVSLSVREIARATTTKISTLDRWMRDQQVLPQWIIYDHRDLDRHQSWIQDGVLCGAAYPLLFVLGRYIDNSEATTAMLASILPAPTTASSWMVCAFGPREPAIMAATSAQGGHMRIGFENNLWRAPGELAQDNAQLIALGIKAARDLGLRIASPGETRQILTPQW